MVTFGVFLFSPELCFTESASVPGLTLPDRSHLWAEIINLYYSLKLLYIIIIMCDPQVFSSLHILIYSNLNNILQANHAIHLVYGGLHQDLVKVMTEETNVEFSTWTNAVLCFGNSSPPSSTLFVLRESPIGGGGPGKYIVPVFCKLCSHLESSWDENLDQSSLIDWQQFSQFLSLHSGVHNRHNRHKRQNRRWWPFSNGVHFDLLPNCTNRRRKSSSAWNGPMSNLS